MNGRDPKVDRAAADALGAQLDCTPMATGSRATHEMFLSLRAGGFTEHQALYLIAMMLRALPNPEPPQ